MVCQVGYAKVAFLVWQYNIFVYMYNSVELFDKRK